MVLQKSSFTDPTQSTEEIMRYILTPQDIIRRAENTNGASVMLCRVRAALSSSSHSLHSIAIHVAEELADTWPEGEGFGSSDGTYVVKDFLDTVIFATGLPFKTGWVDHRLAVIGIPPGS